MIMRRRWQRQRGLEGSEGGERRKLRALPCVEVKCALPATDCSRRAGGGVDKRRRRGGGESSVGQREAAVGERADGRASRLVLENEIEPAARRSERRNLHPHVAADGEQAGGARRQGSEVESCNDARGEEPGVGGDHERRVEAEQGAVDELDCEGERDGCAGAGMQREAGGEME